MPSPPPAICLTKDLKGLVRESVHVRAEKMLRETLLTAQTRTPRSREAHQSPKAAQQGLWQSWAQNFACSPRPQVRGLGLQSEFHKHRP